MMDRGNEGAGFDRDDDALVDEDGALGGGVVLGGSAAGGGDATGAADAGLDDGADGAVPGDGAPAEVQPESQGEDPLIAELGEEGQGDLAPEDLV